MRLKIMPDAGQHVDDDLMRRLSVSGLAAIIPSESTVSIAFTILLLLIFSSLETLIADGPLAHGLVDAAAATALLIAAIAIRPLEGAHLVKSIRPMLLLMVLPALWMVVQILPMPISILAHPIWASARDALNGPVSGHISIDLGDTVIALGRYLSALAIMLTAAVVTIDRQRAEWILLVLAGVATVASLLLIVGWLSGSALLSASRSNGIRASFEALACIGVILAATAADRTIERYETRRTAEQMSLGGFVRMLAASLSALTLCALAVFCAASAPLVFAAVCGVATLAMVVAIRRLGLGRWAASALIIGAVLGAGIFAAAHTSASSDPTLWFAANVPPAQLSVAERMIADNRSGSGAGTFAALLPMYADIDDPPAAAAPTFAAQISIEMGRPAPFIATILAIAMVGMLLRGAFERGRDSFYPAGAAGCAVTLTIEAFLDSSLLTTSVIIVAAIILGLGFAQRLSRVVQ
jgi:hypothetical protein